MSSVKMPVTLERTAAVLCSVILIFQALLLSSCASLPPDKYSDHVASEAIAEKPENGRETHPMEAPDANDTAAPEGPLKIGIQEAILLAMENNQALIVERMNPQIQRTFEQEELAAFDPLLSPQVSNRRIVADRLSRAGSSTESSKVDSITGSVLLDKLFPTGTALALEASTGYTDSSLYSDTFTANRLGFTVTQALLRGLDVQANMARVNQARFDTLISQYELRGFTEVLLEQVESKFWDYALAQRQIDIYTNSLNLAEKQMTETEERIKIGDLAETELAAAQAEVALGHENLINARSALALERLGLLRLLNPSGSMDWNRQIILQYETSPPDVKLEDVEEHVQVALRMRPDLNQARLQIQRGDLDVVRTKNGLLPKMDMFISFGKTGYANTFDRALDNVDGDSYDVTWGLVFEGAPLNRSERAQYTRAVLGRQQLRRSLENLSQLIQVDVRAAYIEVTRTREQISATAATRNFQEEKLRAETEKFRVGKSTSLLVGQAQRDFVASQLAEIEAVANYLKALVALYRLEGSLIHRRGLSAPGAEPVVLELQ
ncbi:MAG: TolC family protein [Planctomycetota bacterium]